MFSDQLPVVTIVICNHNYGRYIKDAVDSALNLNYPKDRYNIFIVDDASTDDSWKILHDNYFKKIPHNKNSNAMYEFKSGKWKTGVGLIAARSPQCHGPSLARNTAISTTINTTDVYAILDADDIYYPDKLIECVKPLVRDERVGVSYADYDILNVETGNIVREFKQPYDKLKLHQECIVHSGAIIRKTALEKTLEETGYYDINMRTCEDYDLWLRISDHYMIVHIPQSLSLVRVHKANATFSVKNEIWQQNWQRIQQKAQTRGQS